MSHGGNVNIRQHLETTPEGRLAAVCRIAMFREVNLHHHLPDYADLRESLRIPVQVELLGAQLDEARLKPDNDERIRQLIEEIALLKAANV
jgi:hypothetical protein